MTEIDPCTCAPMKKKKFFCRRKINPNCDCSRSNQMHETDQTTEIAPFTCAPISELPSNKVQGPNVRSGAKTFYKTGPNKYRSTPLWHLIE